MCRLMMSQSCLKIVTCHYDNSSPACMFCPGITETVEHMLFQCPHWAEMRNIMWNKVKRAQPVRLIEEMNNMSDYERTIFIFSGFRSNHIKEWEEIYIEILLFVTVLYEERQKYDMTIEYSYM